MMCGMELADDKSTLKHIIVIKSGLNFLPYSHYDTNNYL